MVAVAASFESSAAAPGSAAEAEDARIANLLRQLQEAKEAQSRRTTSKQFPSPIAVHLTPSKTFQEQALEHGMTGCMGRPFVGDEEYLLTVFTSQPLSVSSVATSSGFTAINRNPAAQLATAATVAPAAPNPANAAPAQSSPALPSPETPTKRAKFPVEEFSGEEDGQSDAFDPAGISNDDDDNDSSDEEEGKGVLCREEKAAVRAAFEEARESCALAEQLRNDLVADSIKFQQSPDGKELGRILSGHQAAAASGEEFPTRRSTWASTAAQTSAATASMGQGQSIPPPQIAPPQFITSVTPMTPHSLALRQLLRLLQRKTPKLSALEQRSQELSQVFPGEEFPSAKLSRLSFRGPQVMPPTSESDRQSG